MKFLQKLSRKRGAQLLLLLVAGICLSATLAARLAVDRFGLRLDFTDNALYSFSEETHRLTGVLETPVTLTVFSAEADYPSLLQEVLRRYAQLSPYITLQYLDPYQNPLALDALKQKGYTIAPGDIVIEGSRRIRQLAVTDLLLLDSAGETIAGLQAEGQLTAALLYVNSDYTPVVKLTEGHNERPSESLLELLRRAGYEVQRLSLAVEEAGQADLLLIPSPTRDFSEQEIARLEQYLAQGGSLMLFLEPAAEPPANLYTLLARWNIHPQNHVVFEQRLYVAENPVNVVPGYAPHSINSFFADNRYYLVLPQTLSFTLPQDAQGAIDTRMLLFSSGEAYAKSTVNYQTAARQPEDAAGPFVLAATAEQQVNEGSARLLVAGSRSMYSDDVLAMPSYANADFLVQALNWCNPGEASVNIPPKRIAPPPINIFFYQALLWGVLLVLILPAAVLAYGLVAAWKRRKL